MHKTWTERKADEMSAGNPGHAALADSGASRGAPSSVNQHSDQRSFVHTTYIHATAEQVWQGLTDPAFTTRWWRHHSAGGKAFPSDWQQGSTYDLVHAEVGLVVSDPEQVILESKPYRRLAYTWHTFTPEWVAKVGMDEATANAWRAEPRSKVAYDIEEDDSGVVKLTVVHDGFLPGSSVLEGISAGWPAVLASLKTMLETGSPLPW
jgi:uncharacterized protein YndB with AHSA1/START domain